MADRKNPVWTQDNRSSWTEDDIPDQTGRTIVITGANSGLGLHSARALAKKGARVLMACRSAERGQEAFELVRAVAVEAPKLISLDLADLDSVRRAAEGIRESVHDRLDVLMNNAGIMATARSTTKDGFELQFGTNHLGPVALTWLLMPALRNASRPDSPAARVVTISSVAATNSKVDLSDPNFERRRYNPISAYSQSKLANQIFAVELDRRLRSEPAARVLSIAAHPGYTATHLGSSMAKSYENTLIRRLIGTTMWLGDHLVAQKSEMGALPQLFAATAPGLEGGEYIRPRGLGGLRGYPAITRPLTTALSRPLGEELWEITAKLTGVAPDPA